MAKWIGQKVREEDNKIKKSVIGDGKRARERYSKHGAQVDWIGKPRNHNGYKPVVRPIPLILRYVCDLG